jgi:hydrogenase maturation protease
MLVLGVGHPDRGDDAAGLLVADLLTSTPEVVARRVVGDATAVLTDPLWEHASVVVMVDTVRTGHPSGTLHRWEALELLDLHVREPAVTHGLGLAAAIRLAAALGRLPRRLSVVGIEGTSFTVGEPPGDDVVAAAERVAADLANQAAAASVARQRRGSVTEPG